MKKKYNLIAKSLTFRAGGTDFSIINSAVMYGMEKNIIFLFMMPCWSDATCACVSHIPENMTSEQLKETYRKEELYY